MLPTRAASDKHTVSSFSLLGNAGKPVTKKPSPRRIHINGDQRTVVTLHHHEVVIRRQDPFYKVVSVLESVFLVTSSFSLIVASGAISVWAATMVGVI